MFDRPYRNKLDNFIEKLGCLPFFLILGGLALSFRYYPSWALAACFWYISLFYYYNTWPPARLFKYMLTGLEIRILLEEGSLKQKILTIVALVVYYFFWVAFFQVTFHLIPPNP